jgi:membrane protease YdiL (CAAX protease family)
MQILLFVVHSLKGFYRYWTSLGPLKFILFSTAISVVTTIPIAAAFELLGLTEAEIGGADLEELGVAGFVFVGVILAPLLETLFFQTIPIKLVQKFVGWHTNQVAWALSSLLFALAHASYSIWYAIAILPLGMVLAVAYIHFEQKNRTGYWVTAAVHALRNALAVFTLFD